jgi:carbon-monoxide dehydrogenase medium subunit
MKPAAFTYHRAGSLAEVFALIAAHGDEAKLLAGGQSLVPMMNMRLAQPRHLIDINQLAELAYVRDVGSAIEIGALTRQDDIARAALVRESCPLLAAAAGTIGHWAIRQRGTLGGSLAHADPAAQLPLIAVALGAEVAVARPEGERRVAAKDFFVSIMTTALAPGEIVTSVRFPKRRAAEGWAFELFSRRRGDFAIVAVAAQLALDGRGSAAALRLGLGGVGPVPLEIGADLQRFLGRPVDARWCEEVAAATEACAEPTGSPKVPAEFRSELVRVLTRRALEHAAARAKQG